MKYIIHTSIVLCLLGLMSPDNNIYAISAVLDGLDPLQWHQEPHASLNHTVHMATEVIKPIGNVEYYFDCTEGGASDSGWQCSAEYQVTGLKPQTTYTFVAKVRNKSTGQKLAANSFPTTLIQYGSLKNRVYITASIVFVPKTTTIEKYS